MALKKTRRQLSLALQSSPFTSASACDIHCAPLPAPPPQFAPVNAGMQSLSHTWVWEDLNLGLLGDRELWSHGTVLALESFTGEAPTPASRSRSRCTGRAPDQSLCYLSFVHLPQVSKDVQAGRGEMRPHGARTNHGGGLWGPRRPAGSVYHTQLRSTGRPRPPARIFGTT